MTLRRHLLASGALLSLLLLAALAPAPASATLTESSQPSAIPHTSLQRDASTELAAPPPAAPGSLADVCNFTAALRKQPFDLWELALQPYWLVFASALFITLLSYAWNWLLVRTEFGVALTRGCYGMCQPGQQLRTQGSDSSINASSLSINGGGGGRNTGTTQHGRYGRVRDTVDTVLRQHASVLTDALTDGAVAFTLQPAPSFMMVQLMVQVGHLIYIICTLHDGQSHWHRYEELYARLLNGGGAQLLLPVFYSSVAASRAPKGSLPSGYAYALNLYFVALCPVLFTHLVLIYVFLPLIVLLLLVALVGFSPRVVELAVRICGPKVIIVACVVLQCVAIMLVQSSVFYGTMFYDGTNYFDVMWHEYQLRDTRCYTWAIRERIQPMIVSLVSLV